MSISSTGLYGSATIVNSDLFTDVETLKETVTTLNTTYLQTTAEHRADISLNKFDITDTELLNQQQYSYLYDKFRNENRIDRDNLRKDFYDKIDITFDLSRNTYDLSKNPTKYFIVNSIVNRLAEQAFIKDIVNSRLYNSIFSNKAKYNNDLYNNYIGNLTGTSYLPNNTFLESNTTTFKSKQTS